jgi:hypothetical protein
MDERLLKALLREPEASQLEATAAAAPLGVSAPALFASGPAPVPLDYGLDPTGDFDVAAIDASHVRALEQQLADDPEGVLTSARQLWDVELTATELSDALQKTRVFIEQPSFAADAVESLHALEAAVGMPPGWGFEGYDAQQIPISPMDTKFETASDAVTYAATFVAAKVANAMKPKPDFPVHSSSRSFVYDLPETETTIGVLGDFGNGLAHSRYIAKHLRASRLDHLLYLGDVYYCGTSDEFARYLAPEIEPFLTGDVAGGKKVNVMMLNSNHEMFSKGYSYLSYLKYRLAKGAPQRQEGSYFALRFGTAFQIIGIDTDYNGYRKFRDPNQVIWLRQRLAEGRASGALNILVSANEPFEYGKDDTTGLLDDMRPFLPSIDLWLWANTHYCGLFDRTALMPVSSCLGHGGYPYKLAEHKLDRDPYMAPCPAPPLFLETRRRYGGTNLRPDLGNNGYVVMVLDPNQRRVRLEYMDWMKRPRYRAVLGRDNAGRVAVLEGQEL